MNCWDRCWNCGKDDGDDLILLPDGREVCAECAAEVAEAREAEALAECKAEMAARHAAMLAVGLTDEVVAEIVKRIGVLHPVFGGPDPAKEAL